MPSVGFLLFPDMQQLDFTAPYEVFASWGGAEIRLLHKEKAKLVSSTGIAFEATTAFSEAPQLDVIVVPGGAGVDALLLDDETLGFLRETAKNARFVLSVCTGALLLGAAGLLRSRRATTHWAYHELLSVFGAIPVRERIVRDGDLFTGGGVTAGLDAALAALAAFAGEEAAQKVQLQLEYAPAPPFAAGDPQTAPPALVAATRAALEGRRAAREALVKQAAARLSP